MGGGGSVEWVVSIFNPCLLRNLCLPHLTTIDLFEHVGKDFVLDGWRRNEFEFVRFFIGEGTHGRSW